MDFQSLEYHNPVCNRRVRKRQRGVEDRRKWRRDEEDEGKLLTLDTNGNTDPTAELPIF
jgi:hypothetical protein